MPKLGFRVFNKTDEILASPEVFESPEAAASFVDGLRARFRAQGFYLTTKGTRIGPDEVLFSIEPARR